MIDNKFKERIRIWVKALESNYYKKTTCQLRSFNKSNYCCLGVMCEVWDRENIRTDLNKYCTLDIFREGRGLPPEFILEWFGIDMLEAKKLANINDNNKSKKRQFTEVVNYLKKKYLNDKTDIQNT